MITPLVSGWVAKYASDRNRCEFLEYAGLITYVPPPIFSSLDIELAAHDVPEWSVSLLVIVYAK